MAAKDPRGSSQYKRTRTAWKPQAPDRCCLCGKPINKDLPPGLPGSWTVEHQLSVRAILSMTQTWQQAVALACDTDLWDSAHSKCQSEQGGTARHEHDQPETVTGPRGWGL